MKSNVKLYEGDSEYQEYFQNSRIDERNVICGQKTEENQGEVNPNGKLQDKANEYVEHFQSSRDNKISVAVGRAPKLKLVEVNKEVTLKASKDSKDSQNS